MPANVPYEQAVALFSAERYADALPLFDAGVELEPLRARIHANRGLALQRLDMHAEARASVARGIELRGADPYPLVAAARVFEAQGDLAAAGAHAESAWAERAHLDPVYVDGVVEILASSKSREGGWRAGLREIDEALALLPDRASLIAQRATTLALGNQWEEATRAITRALALAPKDAFLEKRADTIVKGRATAADMLANARAATPPESTSWEAWHDLGVALWMNGDPQAAAEAFTRARKHHPDPIFRGRKPVAMSTFEVDCRLALLKEPAPPKPAKSRKASKPRRR